MKTDSMCISKLIDENTEILKRFFHYVSDMVFLMKVREDSKYEYVFVNPPGIKAAHLTPSAIGKCMDDVMDSESTDYLTHNYNKAVQSRQPFTFIHVRAHMIGESNLTPIFDSSGKCTHVLSVTRDITNQKQQEEHLKYLAFYDVLTGLPNRAKLLEVLASRLSSRNEGEDMMLLFLDCDSFKQVNDTFGHEVGDQFLQWMASKLRTLLGDGEDAGRLGGDEFTMTLRCTPGESIHSRLRDIVESLRTIWQMNGQEIPITVSVGVTLVNFRNVSPKQLLREADNAVYQAKKAGGNTFVVYSEVL